MHPPQHRSFSTRFHQLFFLLQSLVPKPRLAAVLLLLRARATGPPRPRRRACMRELRSLVNSPNAPRIGDWTLCLLTAAGFYPGWLTDGARAPRAEARSRAFGHSLVNRHARLVPRPRTHASCCQDSRNVVRNPASLGHRPARREHPLVSGCLGSPPLSELRTECA